ncbi:MAG: FkbM family methyltransferase [Acidobacteriota bacterium]
MSPRRPTLQASVRSGLLRPWRKVGLAVAVRWPWPVEARLTTGRTMYVDLRSAIGRSLFMHGEFDPRVFDPLAARLTPGGVFVDVGANVGYYTLRALDLVGGTGQVHAFEIDPRPLKCLRKTVGAASLTNVRLHETAVGDLNGVAALVMAGDAVHSRVSRTGDGVTVPMTTLDAWRARSPDGRVQALKIDVEGGELGVLRGARTLLENDRPLVVCEALEEQLGAVGASVAALVAWLEGVGYRTRWLEGVWSPVLVGEP